MVVHIIKLVDKILNDEDVDLTKVRRGKNFLISLKNDVEYLKKMVSEFKMRIDKKGLLSGDDIVPLTISILNREGEIPGEETYVGIYSFRIHYYGISPELENFVALVLWPEHSKHSKETLEKILNEVKIAKKEAILKLEGNYRLKLPNEVHPFRAKNIAADEEKLYEWVYVPYLKEIGETIFSHVSPINFKKIYVRKLEGEYKKVYANLKTCVGIIKKVSGGYISIKLPYLNPKNIRSLYTLPYNHSVSDKIKHLKPKDKIAFLVFEEIDGDPHHTKIPRHIIYDIQKIDVPHIIGHILSYILYNYYLLRERLLVISYEEYKKLFDYVLKITKRFCKGFLDVSNHFMKDDLIFSAFLSPFFYIKENDIYFSPSFLRGHYKEIELFDEKLSAKEKDLFDGSCLHENSRIKEYSEKGNLLYCPCYEITLRENAPICKNCEYYILSERNINLQKSYNFLRMMLKLKNFICMERLEKFSQLTKDLLERGT